MSSGGSVNVNSYLNPFSADADRAQIWEMLVARDIRAFIAGDWDQVADDFLPDAFLAIDGRMRSDPDSWRLGFETLEEYRVSWLEQSSAMRDLGVDIEASLYEATTLRDIELRGRRALAHKKFDGGIRRRDGGVIPLHWQTLYMCEKVSGRWKIAGFLGYLSHPFGTREPASLKQLPDLASSPSATSPYSPVLIIRSDQIVVVSGQTGIGSNGAVVGSTIDEQVRASLKNCAAQLARVGSSLSDVFKVNAYLADIDMLDGFNAAYRDVMPEILPVRTTVGVHLPRNLLVEIEMWAVHH